MFNFRWFGFETEFKALPTGGVVVAAHRTLKNLRAKQFAFVVAGPAINLLFVAAICVYLNPDEWRSPRMVGHGWQPELAFLYANLFVLLANLWPHDVNTSMGTLPSDGKLLLHAFYLSPEKQELSHAASFVLEAASCYENRDYAGSKEWVQKGLAIYPDNEQLLNWYGMVEQALGEYHKARECYINLLERENLQPMGRFLLLNNIAYGNVFIGGDALLKEADEFSQEAMEALGWVPAIRGTRGAVLVAMGNFDEGLPLLHESMSQAEFPDHKAQNACLIAEAEYRRGNLSAARMYLEEARKLESRCSLIARVESILEPVH